MASNGILLISTVALVIVLTDCCTFPTALRGSWLSSEKGYLTFDESWLSGYTVHTFSTDNFTCLETSGTQYVVKSTNRIRYLGLRFYVYLCLDLREINSTYIFKYYKASAEEPDANNERVKFKLSSFGDASFSEVCTVSDFTDVPYSVLMKNGSVDNASSECPIPFLGNFQYGYDTGDGTNLCPNSSLTVCDDKKTMTWNYTECSQIQAYSAGGVTKCLYSSNQTVASGNDTINEYTLHVYNMDNETDESTTYRITCYRIAGYENVTATQYPGDCPASMNNSYVESPGAYLNLTADLLCAYDEVTTILTTNATTPVITTTPSRTTAAPEEEALSAGIIAAIVIIIIILIAAIIIVVVCLLLKKRNKRRRAEWEALNRKVDPDELSPNMRLGLPDESRYDLDRLMFSPEDGKNGFLNKAPRREQLVDGLEGYDSGKMYMDEEQRQTAMEAGMFIEKRKRKDNKDEFKAATARDKMYAENVKSMGGSKRRPLKLARMAAMAKMKFKPKAKPRARESPEGSENGGRGTGAREVVIQVEEATDGDRKRKTRFADESEDQGEGHKSKEGKPLDQVETLSDIADIENAVDDLSDDDTREPRLILPKLNSKKGKRKRRKRHKNKENSKKLKVVVTKYVPFKNTGFVKKIVLYRPNPNAGKKVKPAWNKPPVLRPRSRPWSAMIRRLRHARANQISPMKHMSPVPPLMHKLHGNKTQPKDRSSHGPNPQTPAMPTNTRFKPSLVKRKSPEDQFTEPLPLSRSDSTLKGMHPLARIHRKDNPKLWKEHLGDMANGMESMDLATLKRNFSDNRWRRLLQELYADKKYFDYFKETTSESEAGLLSSADESLQFLYGRAIFWEDKEPIPTRPPSHVRRLFSRHEPNQTPSKLQRSSTVLSRNGVASRGLTSITPSARVPTRASSRFPPRTPSTRLPPRTPSTQISRLKKREASTRKRNTKEVGKKSTQSFFEDATQTEFSPIPSMTPVDIVTEGNLEAFDNLSPPMSPDRENIQTPVIPLIKEVTRSDIKLEEYNPNDDFDEVDENHRYENQHIDEDVVIAV